MLSIKSFLIETAFVVALSSAAIADEPQARAVPAEAYAEYCAGVYAAETEDWDSAMQSFEKTLALDPSCIEAHLAIAFISDEQLRRPIKAKHHFQKALELDPKNFSARYGMARQLLRAGQLDKAGSELASALKESDEIDSATLARAYTEFAFAFELAGRRQQAIEYYKKSIDAAANPLMPMLRLAYLYRSGGDYADAITTFRNMQELAPGFAQIDRELCDTYALMGEWTSALEELKIFMSRRDGPGEQPYLLKQAAEFAEKSGQIDAARFFNEKLLLILLDEHPPNDAPPNVCQDIATALEGLGRYEQALPYLARAFESAAGESKNMLRMRLALIHDKMGNQELCLRELETCVKDAEPAYSITYRVELASAYERYGNMEQAERVLREILNIPGSRAAGQSELGLFESRRGNHDAAVAYLKKAIEQADTQELVRFKIQLSIIFNKAGRPAEAENELISAHEIFPDNPSVNNALGWHYAERGEKLDRALELVQTALKHSPANAYYIDSLGWIYFKQGKISEALEQLEKAASLSQDAVIFDHLGDVYEASGDIQRAVEYWSRALQHDPKMQSVQDKLDKANQPTNTR